jgi:hypothetical protein
MARNSVPYNGRGPCMRCRWCCGFACEVDAKNGSQNTVIPVALEPATANCAPSAWPRRSSPTIAADAIAASPTLTRRPLAGAALRSCRGLRLRSRVGAPAAEFEEPPFPNGLGNRYDQVGRNLQGHHYTGAIGYFDFDTYDDVGPGASIAISDYNHGTPGPRAAAACWPTNSFASPFT